jgi:hypothetical protein
MEDSNKNICSDSKPSKNKNAQEIISLKELIFSPNGKPIEALIKECFLDFYLKK